MNEADALAALDLPADKVEAKEEPKEVIQEKAEEKPRITLDIWRERQEAKASRNGWKPLDEFVEAGGDPEDWRDAGAFNAVGDLTKKLREKDREYDERAGLLNKLHAAQLMAAQEKKENAIEAGDKVGVAKADQQIRELNAPLPVIDKKAAEWEEQNPWIFTDTPKAAYAKVAFIQAVNSGMVTKDAIAAMEKEVAKHYPPAKAPERTLRNIDTGEKGGGSKGFGNGREATLSMKDLTAQEREIYSITGSAYKNDAAFLRAVQDSRKGAQ